PRVVLSRALSDWQRGHRSGENRPCAKPALRFAAIVWPDVFPLSAWPFRWRWVESAALMTRRRERTALTESTRPILIPTAPMAAMAERPTPRSRSWVPLRKRLQPAVTAETAARADWVILPDLLEILVTPA